MPLAVGASPLDDVEVARSLSRLNKLRNDIVHRGETCTEIDAQKALKTVHSLLMFLNEHGATLDLPDELAFWTSWDLF